MPSGYLSVERIDKSIGPDPSGLQDCRMVVTICKSEAHARDLEALLIAEFQPKLNIAGKSLNSSMAKALREA